VEDIYTRLTNAIFEFTNETGKTPEYIYAGQKEKFEFYDYAHKTNGGLVTQNPLGGEPIVMGLQLLSVGRDNHLRVS